MSIFPTRVLLAADGSEDARLAATHAIELTRVTGSELHVVYVGQIYYVGMDSRVRIDPTGVPTVQTKHQAQRTLDEELKVIEDAGGSVREAHLRMGAAPRTARHRRPPSPQTPCRHHDHHHRYEHSVDCHRTQRDLPVLRVYSLLSLYLSSRAGAMAVSATMTVSVKGVAAAVKPRETTMPLAMPPAMPAHGTRSLCFGVIFYSLRKTSSLNSDRSAKADQTQSECFSTPQTVMTTFPRAWPVSRYRIASAVAAKG